VRDVGFYTSRPCSRLGRRVRLNIALRRLSGRERPTLPL
jgi:hypothetical protein